MKHTEATEEPLRLPRCLPSGLTTKFRRVRPDNPHLRNNARPHVACNDWFGTVPE